MLVDALAAADRPAEALRRYRRAAEALAEAGLEPSADCARRSGPCSPARAERPGVGPAVGAAPAAGSLGPPPLGPHPSSAGTTTSTCSTTSWTGPGCSPCSGRAASEDTPRHRGRHRRGGAAAMGCGSSSWLGPDGDAVPDAVVDALGLEAEQPRPRSAGPGRQRSRLLVVLDNAEHVVDAAGPPSTGCCRAGRRPGPDTSRERLASTASTLDRGSAPRRGTAARAPVRRAGPRRRAGPPPRRRRPRVGEIVERLDGLPLALEMAAAQLATASLDELAATLADRVDHLQSRGATSPSATAAWPPCSAGRRTASTSGRPRPRRAGRVRRPGAGVGRRRRARWADEGGHRPLAGGPLARERRSLHLVPRFQLLFTIRASLVASWPSTAATSELGPARHLVPRGRRRGRPSAARPRQQPATPSRGALAELRAAHRWAMPPRRRGSRCRRTSRSTPTGIWPTNRAVGRARLTPSWTAGASTPPLLTAAATVPSPEAISGSPPRSQPAPPSRAGRTGAGLAALEVLGDAAIYDGRLEDCLAVSNDLGRAGGRARRHVVPR